MSSAKWRPFCLGLIVLRYLHSLSAWLYIPKFVEADNKKYESSAPLDIC